MSNISRRSLLLSSILTSVAAGAQTPDDEPASAELKFGGGRIDVVFRPGELDLPRIQVMNWIRNAARAVAGYYGRFPVASTRVRVIPAPDRAGVFHGTTWGTRGPLTRISVGQHTTQEQLDDDWMMAHELIHLAFPDVDERHHWIEEGISTYVEPIARAQAGLLPPTRVWGDMARSMERGQPGPGDRGLDNTHTWGRTYWGGAIFCLAADVEIHKRTGNRKGLQDALRSILAAGGNIQAEWPLTRALETGDSAAGVAVLSELYTKMKDAPVRTDLDALWRQLGVAVRGSDVVFDDGATLAATRRAIMEPKPA